MNPGINVLNFPNIFFVNGTEPEFGQMGLKQLPRRTIFAAHDRLLSVVPKAFDSLSVNTREWIGEKMSVTDRFMSVTGIWSTQEVLGRPHIRDSDGTSVNYDVRINPDVS